MLKTYSKYLSYSTKMSMTRIYDNHTLQTIANHWLSVARTVLDSPYYLQKVRESAYLMCPLACLPRAKSALFLIATMPFFYPGGNTSESQMTFDMRSRRF